MTGGWMNCCKNHLPWLKKDIKKHGWVVQWWTPDADKRCKCGVKCCKNRAYYEIGWGKKSLDDKEGKFVPFKL